MNKHLLSLKMVGYKFSLFSLMILSSKQGTANYMLKEEETLQKKKIWNVRNEYLGAN